MGRLANKIKTEKDIYSAHKYMWTKQDNSNEKRKSSEQLVMVDKSKINSGLQNS